MSLAESDAKFKSCPLLKTADDKLRFCLASACMMWRRASAGSDEGWCGLAGKPVEDGAK